MGKRTKSGEWVRLGHNPGLVKLAYGKRHAIGVFHTLPCSFLKAAAREAATQKDCVSELPDVKHAPLSRVLTLALQEKGDDIEEVTPSA